MKILHTRPLYSLAVELTILFLCLMMPTAAHAFGDQMIVTGHAGPHGSVAPTFVLVTIGSSVTFTAYPDPGYTVDKWTMSRGSKTQDGGNSFWYFNVQSDNAIGVTFKPLPNYIVTPTAGVHGAISPNTPQTAYEGSDVTFTAVANFGYTADTWSLDGTDIQIGGATYTLKNVTDNHTVNVTYKPLLTHHVTPTTGANGAITPNTPRTVYDGGSITFKATPNVGYTVDTWSLDGTKTQTGGITYLLNNVTTDHTVKLIFKRLPTYTVTPTTGTNGAISPNQPQTVTSGSYVTFIATGNAGYTTDSWYLDGKPTQACDTQYTLKNITADHTVKVTFKLLTFAITPSAGPNGTINPNTPQNMTFSGNITFTATANANYMVDAWLLDGASVQTGGIQYLLKNVSADHVIKVTFKVQTFTISPTAGPNGVIIPNTPQAVAYGNSITLSATANANYSVDTWSLDGAAAQTGGSQYMLKNITANHAVKVTFKFCPSYQPDLAICNANDSSYLGYSVINMDGTNQTKNQSSAPNVAANYLFQVKNAGNTTDTFVLTCPVSASCTGWTVQMVDIANGKDVTAAFTGSGVKVTLAMGAKGNYTLRITPSAYVCDSLRLAITAVSAGDATKKDVVKAGITVSTPAQPDLSICNAGDSLYLGGSIVNQDGSNQTKSQAASSGKIATFLFRVQNAGTSADTYTLTCPLPSLSGWTVKCLDSTGKDVTTALTGAAGSKTVSLAPGALANYTLQVTPGIAAVSSKPYALLITATSVRDATKKDAVKAVTTKP